MKAVVKIRKANSPAFNKGEVWKGCSGSTVIIQGVRQWTNKEDWSVVYLQSDGTEVEKEIWNFQVRYTHISDL